MRLSIFGAAALAILTNVAVARADQALLGFANYGTGGAEVRTLGWEFTLSKPIVVTHLGLWDYGADGLIHSHLVTIWSTGSNPQRLVEGTVPSGGAPGSVWRWVSVTPTSLLPGTYRIGAVYPIGGANPPPTTHDLIAAFAQTVTTATPITYVKNVYGTTTGYPDRTYPPEEKGYFGPNFLFVPEPAGTQLPVFLLMAAGWFRWRSWLRKNG